MNRQTYVSKPKRIFEFATDMYHIIRLYLIIIMHIGLGTFVILLVSQCIQLIFGG